jgi:glyoxylase-like metal-dependent hydrolase (beta-lactamase superfamily II)
MISLRNFLAATAATLLAACSLGSTVRTGPRADSVPGKLPVPEDGARLADDAVLLRGHYVLGAQPDGNSVVFAAPDGLVVVDTGRHPAHAEALLAVAAKAQRPIVAIVNTHWHLDHVGGNPRLRVAHPGLRVLASNAIEGAMGGFLKGYRTQLNQALAKAKSDAERAQFRAEIALIDQGKALYPDERIAAAGTRTLGGRAFHVGVETNAVTAGDVWLLDRNARLLVAGDLVTLPAPFLDTACPARWQAALKRLEAQPFDRLVPGHGPMLDRAGFVRYRTAFDNLLACAASTADAGTCVAGWHRDADPLIKAGKDREAADALLKYYLAKVLRGPDAARTAKRCAKLR